MAVRRGDFRQPLPHPGNTRLRRQRQLCCSAAYAILVAGVVPSILTLPPASEAYALFLGRRQSLLPRAAGFIENIGKGVLEATTAAVTGMNEEEREKLVAKLMAGNMDFRDHLKMMMLTKSSGGVGGILDTASKIPGLKNAMGLDRMDEKNTEVKLEDYSKIIEAMTEEEREQPGYFLYGQSAGENSARVAKAAGVSEATMAKYLKEFEMSRKLFANYGAGKLAGKSDDQITKDLESTFSHDDGAEDVEVTPKGTMYTNPLKAEKRKQKMLRKKEAFAALKSSGGTRRTSRRNQPRMPR